MRILILFDKSITSRRSEVDTALERIKSDYKDATNVSWIYEDRDFSTLRWVEYQPTYLGIAWDIIAKDANAVPKDKYDNIIYLVSEENWKANGIGGWSLGTPINGFQIQLIRIYANGPEWLYKTFAMEIAHGWNDMTIQELGDNLLADFGVSSFDNEVVHGCNKKYGINVPDNPPMTGYFTNYDYTPMIAMIKDKLKNAYSLRKIRYENQPQFLFTRNLYLGMRGNDVLELQKRLVLEGVATYNPTGYFGLLTRASVVMYQKKHNITPAFGFVGSITRNHLNTIASAVPEAFEIIR